MSAPFIVKSAATAAKAASAGAAKIALTEKAAKATASAFKSMKEMTEMGGFQQLENITENIKNSGPVMGAFQVLQGKITVATIDNLVDLAERLMTLMESEAGLLFMNTFIGLLNIIIGGSAELITAIDKISNFLYDLFGFGDEEPNVAGIPRYQADTGSESQDAVIDYLTAGSGWWGGW